MANNDKPKIETIASQIENVKAEIASALSVYIGDVPPEPGPMTVTHTGGNTGGHSPNFNGYNQPIITDGIQWIGPHNPPYQLQPIGVNLNDYPLKSAVGDICYRTDTKALCIYDGESWKTLLPIETMKEAFQDFKAKGREEVKGMARFLELELDDEEQIPKNIQDELLTQAFRLKIYRLMQSLKEEENGTKIPSNTNGESTKGNP